MRIDTAVAELIGAVLLIAVVIGGMSLIAVLMLSTPPPEKVPKASISAYCVACVDGIDVDHYEVLIYNGGGESLERSKLKFFLKNSNPVNSGGVEITPYLVYSDVPEYCGSEFGDSPAFENEKWESSENWVSGQTLRFFIPMNNGEKPQGIFIQYWPYTSNIASADFSSFRDKPSNWNPILDYPNGSISRDLLPPYYLGLLPIFIEKTPKDEEGKCKATFTYIVEGDIPPEIFRDLKFNPANQLIGEDIEIIYPNDIFIIEDGKEKGVFEEEGSGKDRVTFQFTKDLIWKLGKTKSERVLCE